MYILKLETKKISNLCETKIFAVAVLKSKYRFKLNVKKNACGNSFGDTLIR